METFVIIYSMSALILLKASIYNIILAKKLKKARPITKRDKISSMELSTKIMLFSCLIPVGNTIISWLVIINFIVEKNIRK